MTYKIDKEIQDNLGEIDFSPHPTSKDIITMVAEARQAVIKAGGRPTTLKISLDAIEKTKLFGMDIEVVSSVVMPEGVDFMVIEDKDKIL